MPLHARTRTTPEPSASAAATVRPSPRCGRVLGQRAGHRSEAGARVGRAGDDQNSEDREAVEEQPQSSEFGRRSAARRSATARPSSMSL